MSTVAVNSPAPDFTLADYQGNEIALSQFTGRQPVLLVLNRGFTWPFCRAHLAQLRQDYELFLERGVALLVIGPEKAEKFAKYFSENQLPFPGLPDPEHQVLRLYGQQIKIFKFGRMPAQVLVDKEGIARYVHYGTSMKDIPTSRELLDLLS